MQLYTKQLPDSHNIFFFGDKHEGSSFFSESGFNKLCHLMNSEYEGCKNNYGIDGGDMIDAITPDDRRFSPDKMKEPMAIDQVDLAVKRLEPIKDKLLTILMGNHEYALWRFGDIANKVADKLKVPYGTFATKLSIITPDKGDLMYKIFDTHGHRSISSAADDPQRRRTNMELTLKRQLKFKAGDCAVQVKHHVHKLLVTKPISELYLVDNGKEIKQAYTGWGQNEKYIHPDARWYGCAGSFLKLYGDGISGYAEMAEYDPVELGFLVLKVRDRKIVSLEPHYIGL